MPDEGTPYFDPDTLHVSLLAESMGADIIVSEYAIPGAPVYIEESAGQIAYGMIRRAKNTMKVAPPRHDFIVMHPTTYWRLNAMTLQALAEAAARVDDFYGMDAGEYAGGWVM